MQWTFWDTPSWLRWTEIQISPFDLYYTHLYAIIIQSLSALISAYNSGDVWPELISVMHSKIAYNKKTKISTTLVSLWQICHAQNVSFSYVTKLGSGKMTRANPWAVAHVVTASWKIKNTKWTFLPSFQSLSFKFIKKFISLLSIQVVHYVILMFKKVIFLKVVSIVTALLMRLIMKVKFVVSEK